MKRTKVGLCILLFLTALGAAGCSGTGGAEQGGDVVEQKEEETVKTFADYTDNELFRKIPALLPEDGQFGNVEDYGGGTYLLAVNGSTMEEFQAYQTLLEEEGFTKYVDNGETGLDGAVYTATYTKDDLVLTVTHMTKLEKTYLTAAQGLPLSEHLLYQEAYTAGNQEGAKTSLHMLEMYDNGNSFVIQLKDGHFIVNDGGLAKDLPYLLDYLESLTSEGEKPVIEAWIISHAHGDHVGAFNELIKNSDNMERIIVEGIYFNEPSSTLCERLDSSVVSQIRYMPMVARNLKTTKGTAPEIYRVQTGQRYYFNDITMDILHTQEQMVYGSYSGDYNDSSTWCMFTIEGQKFLHAGDAEFGSVDVVMNTYDKEYFDLDVFAVFHHGINVYDYFTDFCTLKTVLYTNYRCGSYYGTGTHAHEEENAHLIAASAESLAHGDGTKVLTFPYEVGTAKSLPAREWKYETEERSFAQPRVKEFETVIINKK